MLLNIFLGCSIFLLTNISLLYSAYLFTRRFAPNTPPSVRWVAIGTLFYAFIILLFQVLSPFYAITKLWVTTSCLLFAFVAHLAWGKQRNFNADIESIRVWMRDGFSSKWSMLMVICGFVVLLSLSRALLMPPLAWDALSYHLTFAAMWIKKGTLLFFSAPDQIAENVHFPINGDIIAAWYLLPFFNDLLVNTMNFPITLLGGISCYAIAKELGLSKKEGGFAAALICFAPMIYSQITTQYIDNAVFAFSTVAVLFTLRYLKRGVIYDGILSLVAAGILLGMKYTGIPVVGIIFLATMLKTIRLVSPKGSLKKMGLIIVSLLILCSLGGRNYILNFLDAANPLYPLPLNIFNHELFEGSDKLEQVSEWVYEWEEEHGFDKFSLWEKEYGKLVYATRTAGPKFLLFFILAVISLFARPREITSRIWYFLAALWIIPIVIFYADISADFARRGVWMQGSSRFLSFPIALFTIQSFFIFKKFNKAFVGIDVILVMLVGWDVLLSVNKSHLWEVEVLYPVIVLMLFIIIVFRKGIFNFKFLRTVKLKNAIISRSATFIVLFIILATGLYFLQGYRDNTRYIYYREHFDSVNFPRDFVDGWEFVDRPDQKKTIALAMNWNPPGHRWFFYPLMGRWLQNDILYISAKYKWEVPAWLHKGMLRGKDLSVWLANIERNKVDYFFVVNPWPIELQWMLRRKDDFQIVFSDRDCKIFDYRGVL